MKSICLFSSYFNQQVIPYYIKFYLEELNKHFSEVVFITNQKELNSEELNAIALDLLHNNSVRLYGIGNEIKIK